MKNKFLGKVISAMLALALVIAMLPATAAAATAADYDYVFNNAAHRLPANPKPADRVLTSGLHTIEETDTDVSDSWGFVNAYGYAGLATLPDKLNWEMLDENKDGVVFAPGLGSDSVLGRRAALAFEIVAEEGVFDASLSAIRTTTSTQLEVYLLPKSVATNSSWKDAWEYTNSAAQSNFYNNIMDMSANYRIGKIDLYGKGSESEDIYIGRVELTEENYYLVLVPCGVNEDAELNINKRWQMSLTNFKLDAVSGSVEVNEETFDPAAAFTSGYRNSGSSYTSSENIIGTFSATQIQVRRYTTTAGNGPFAAFKVNVDVAGDYNLSFMTDRKLDYAAAPAVYLSKTTEEEATGKNGTAIANIAKIPADTSLGYFDFSEATPNKYEKVTKDGTAAVLTLAADTDYYIVLAPDSTSFLTHNNVVIKGNDKNTTYDTFVDGVPTDAAYYQEFYLSGIRLTQVVEPSAEEVARQKAYIADRELYNTLTSVTAVNNEPTTLDGYSPNATVTVVAQDIETGEPITGSVENEVTKANEEYTPVAPKVDGYEFMYWAMGIGDSRKIVSIDETRYSFKVAPERNMVYAVYRKTNSDKKYAFFFDGSKTFMEKRVISDGSVTLPALPGAMPGFGNATGWKYTGEENELALSEDTMVTDLEDDTFFVADYNDKKTVTVTIDGTPVNVPYGEDVNLGNYASIRKDKSGYEVFNYWKKGEEIISFKPDYTFKAYEDCILKPTYEKYEPLDKTVRRILLSADSATGITFAEFIGLDSAIEKGILFGDAEVTYTTARAKAVMQTDGNIFSVVNKTGKTAIGYAILADGKIVYSDR